MTSPVPDALRTQLAEALPHEDWCHHDQDCCGCNCDTTRDLLVQRRLLPIIAPLLARARVGGAAEALRVAAKDWRWSAWSDAPRNTDRVAERIGTANYVGDWLSDRAIALSASTTTEGNPT